MRGGLEVLGVLGWEREDLRILLEMGNDLGGGNKLKLKIFFI